MRPQWFTHVRLLVAHLTRCQRAFPVTLTTPALDRRSLRRFGLPACTANPEGQTSITGTARIVLATFYIAITLLMRLSGSAIRQTRYLVAAGR